MKMSRVVLAASLLFFVREAGLLAFTHTGNGLAPHLSSNQVQVFDMDNDFLSGGAFGFNGAGTPPGATTQDLLNQLDRVTQQWSMFSRMNLAVAINPTAVALPNADCSGGIGFCIVSNPPGRNQIIR